MFGAAWVAMAKAARTGRLSRYCTPLEATLRTIHSSRGTLVDRTICASVRSARAADVTPRLNHCHGNCPHSRKTM